MGGDSSGSGGFCNDVDEARLHAYLTIIDLAVASHRNGKPISVGIYMDIASRYMDVGNSFYICDDPTENPRYRIVSSLVKI